MRRLFDLLLAVPALLMIAPVFALAGLAIRLSSPGPVFYRADRVGLNGRRFTMYKMRTMHCRSVAGSSITAANDSRVFAAGKILRAFKIDELPQLWNIVLGDMSIVGPRPEAPDIVERHYTADYHKSLLVRPGLTSPGSVFYYTHGEQLLAEGDAEEFYVAKLLPPKMALDLDYLKTASVFSDIGVIFQTASVLVQKALGRKAFPLPQLLVKQDALEAGQAETSAARTAA